MPKIQWKSQIQNHPQIFLATSLDTIMNTRAVVYYAVKTCMNAQA